MGQKEGVKIAIFVHRGFFWGKIRGNLAPVWLNVVGSTEKFDFSGAGRKAFDHPIDFVWFVAGGTDLK